MRLTALLRVQLRPYTRAIALVLTLQFAQTLATLYLPTLNAHLIDDGVVKGDIGYILRVGGVMLAVTAVQITCAMLAVYRSARTAMSVGRDVRSRLFHKVQAFSTRDVEYFGAPSLITRTTNDVQQIQTLVLLLFTVVVPAPVMTVGAIVLAARQDLPLSSLLLIVAPIVLGISAVLVYRMSPLFRVMQARIDTTNRILREQITGIRVIRAFVQDNREKTRFKDINLQLTEVSRSVSVLVGTALPTTILVINLASVAVVWFGAHRIAADDMQIGALIAFLNYLTLIMMAITSTTFIILAVPRAEVCADRVQEVLDTTPSLPPPTTPVTVVSSHGEVELQAVEFSYPGAQDAVLRGIDLHARAGETLAIVGSTGSGKSTLLSLIPRLADVTGGRILVNGVDVRELDPRLLATFIGYIPQKAYLFSGTVASNLRYGRPEATEEEMWHALEIAQARDFVAELPAALDAPIAQGGTNVSGGQRQRLAIARALILRPEIYLFDDALSALDQATETALRVALAREIPDATVLMVAQRISTIRTADQIVVLDEGLVVGKGTHAALMADNTVYREIVLSQFTEQEAIS